MPIGFDSLRVGETVWAVASVTDAGGVSAFTANQAWSVPVGTSVSAVEDATNPLAAAIEALESGSATVRLAFDDALGDPHTADLPVTVLDASRVVFAFGPFTNCVVVRGTAGSLTVRPTTNAGDAEFGITAIALDARDDDENLPEYELDAIEWSTDSQRVLFSGFGAVATDTMTVTCVLDSVGTDTIHFEAENSSGQPITADIQITILAASTVSFAFSETDPTP